jgi:hypothetical protein
MSIIRVELFDCMSVVMSFLALPDIFHLGLTCKSMAEKLPQGIAQTKSFTYYDNERNFLGRVEEFKQLEELTIVSVLEHFRLKDLALLSMRFRIRRLQFLAHYPRSEDPVSDAQSSLPNLKSFLFVGACQPNNPAPSNDGLNYEKIQLRVVNSWHYSFHIVRDIATNYKDKLVNMLTKNPVLLEIPGFATLPYVRDEIACSLSDFVHYVMNGADLDDFFKFENSLKYWRLVKFRPSKKTVITMDIPAGITEKYHIRIYGPATPAEYLLRAASVFLLQQKKGRGSYAKNYNEWATYDSVQFALKAIRLMYENVEKVDFGNELLTKELDTYALTAASEFSTRAPKDKMFSFQEFEKELINREEKTEEPRLKKQKI